MNGALIPILFGSNHDFENNVIVSSDLGLIRVSPRKDQTSPETKKGK